MTAAIITVLSVLVFVLLSPFILFGWLFSLIWKLIKAIITGIDDAWNRKQEEKYYRNYYYSDDRYRN